MASGSWLEMRHGFVSGPRILVGGRVLAGMPTLTLGIASCGATSGIDGTPGTTGSARQVGQLLFAASLADNQELYLEDLSTGGLTRLTSDPAPDAIPVWSPDGTHIAYV